MRIEILPLEYRKQHITVDVEEWFHILGTPIPSIASWENLEPTVERNTYKLLDIFDTFNQKITFFFLGWVGKKYPKLVMEVNKRGHEVASHGFYHMDCRAFSDNKFYEDIKDTKMLLEDITSQPILGYRSPAFSSAEERFFIKILEAGYIYDASVFPAKRDTGNNSSLPNYPFLIRTINEKALYEFPISTYKFFGRVFPNGGGYFRIFPLWLSKKVMQKMLTETSGYLMFYIHPREVDCGVQPRIDIANRMKRLKTYFGLKKTAKKLSATCKRFSSVPIKSLFITR